MIRCGNKHACVYVHLNEKKWRIRIVTHCFVRWRLLFFYYLRFFNDYHYFSHFSLGDVRYFLNFFSFFVRWRLVNNWFSQFKKNSLQSILKCHKNSWRLFFVIISGVTQKFSGFSLCSFATWSTPLVFEYFSSEWFFSM